MRNVLFRERTKHTHALSFYPSACGPTPDSQECSLSAIVLLLNTTMTAATLSQVSPLPSLVRNRCVCGGGCLPVWLWLCLVACVGRGRVRRARGSVCVCLWGVRVGRGRGLRKGCACRSGGWVFTCVGLWLCLCRFFGFHNNRNNKNRQARRQEEKPLRLPPFAAPSSVPHHPPRSLQWTQPLTNTLTSSPPPPHG